MPSCRLTSLVLVTAVATLVALVASPAVALPKSNTTADTLTLVGSDTTQFFDDALCVGVNADADGDNPTSTGKAKDTCVNVHAFAVRSEQTKVAVADVFGKRCTWSIPPAAAPAGSSCAAGGNGMETAPSGSSAGAARQEADPSDTSVDVGRSSSLQCDATRPQLRCFAFGRDAVGYATYRTDIVTLTSDQLAAIYSCAITKWTQIPGAGTGIIRRYFPQEGSGTAAFFVANFLGGVDPRLSTSCPVTQIDENDGKAIPPIDRSNAIVPFSAGSWIAQGNGVIQDTRHGIKIGNLKVGSKTFVPISGTGESFAPDPVSFSEDSAYPGARYVFHDIDTRAPQYAPALRFFGFDATGRSALCSGAYAVSLEAHGFLALDDLADDSPDAGTCRRITG